MKPEQIEKIINDTLLGIEGLSSHEVENLKKQAKYSIQATEAYLLSPLETEGELVEQMAESYFLKKNPGTEVRWKDQVADYVKDAYREPFFMILPHLARLEGENERLKKLNNDIYEDDQAAALKAVDLAVQAERERIVDKLYHMGAEKISDLSYSSKSDWEQALQK